MNTIQTETNIENNSLLNQENLKQFSGTESWFRHPAFKNCLYTEGVQFVAEQGAAYWLLDKIFACQTCISKLANEPFVTWELIRNKEGNGARLECSDGNCNNLYSENIIYTDFPLQSIKFYFIDNVLLLPSEY